MVPAVTAAASWQATVRILSECEPRRDDRQREGSEQQDGKKAAHDRTILSVRRSRTAREGAG
jgi:hypothetical protein